MSNTIRLSPILAMLVFCSCSSTNRENIEYIIYGTFAGECVGHCATMYKLEETRVLVDTSDSFFDNYGRSIRFNTDTLEKQYVAQAQAVKQQLPELLLRSSSREFGCPDCHDQGGIFIELKSGSTIKRFYIDIELDKIPGELTDYVKLIRKTTGFNTL